METRMDLLGIWTLNVNMRPRAPIMGTRRSQIQGEKEGRGGKRGRRR